MGLALQGALGIYCVAVLYHVAVIFLHEAALQHVITGIEGEPVVIEALGEPVVSLFEVIVVVLYVTYGIAAGRGVV